MKKRIKKSLFIVIVKQITEYWYFYLIAVVSLIFTHYIQSLFPVFAKDLALMVEGKGATPEISFIILMAGALIVFRTASRFFFFYPARILQRNLRVELLSEIEESSPTRYGNFSSGQIYQTLFHDIEHIRTLVGFVILQVVNVVIAGVILIPKIMKIHPSLILSLIPLVISLFLFSILAAANKNLFRKAQDYQGDVQNFIIESYAGKQTIKSYSAEKSFSNVFKDYSFKELYCSYVAGFRISFARPIMPLGVGISLLWGAIIIKNAGLGASTLIMFSGFIFLFLEPLMFISWVGFVLTRSLGAWQRILLLIRCLNRESDIEHELHNLNDDADELNIFFWDRKVHLPIEKNKINVLISKTGVGKSECLKQIAEILTFKKQSLFMVFQDPYLYNDSLLNNIFLGREVTEELKDKAYDLLKVFVLDFLGSSRDELLALEVGENGKRLSGGQAKRLCLVRSILSECEYLLWDDPFSSVDVILENQIMNKIKDRKLLINKTIIMSTHRLSSVENSDYVFYLDKERGVSESGEVNNLLTNLESETYEHFKDQMV